MSDLKTVVLNVIKKNRVYFKCINSGGYEVKLRVTPASENLQLGKQELLVKDETIRTKYGVDVIYSLEAEIKEKGIVTLKHKYNTNLVEKCKMLGGRWDDDQKVWVFSKIVEDKVEELDEHYNANIKDVEITRLRDGVGDKAPVQFLGYPIASASGRDSGSHVCEGVALVSGKIGSGGSVKNWTTNVAVGSVFRLQVSQGVIERYAKIEDPMWAIKVIE